MSLYKLYLNEIAKKENGLQPKPIENGQPLKEIISHIKDSKVSTEMTRCTI